MKNKRFAVIGWLLALVVAHLFLFYLSSSITTALWITYGFTLAAFLSQLVLWLMPSRSSKELSFLRLSTFALSVAYLVIQLVWGLIVAVAALNMSAKLAVLINALLLVIMWLLLIGSMAARNMISKTDNRQKDHHVEL